MIEFAKRRMIGSFSVVVVALLFLSIYLFFKEKLVSTSLPTGFILLAMMFFLVGLNWRKRVSFLPVGRASTWLQVHIYVGWASIAMFLIHTGFNSPNGGLELTIAILFWMVAVSGVLGLILSRAIPRRLTQNGGNITQDLIPKLRRDIKRRSEELVVKSIEETKKSTVADFYVERMEVFFMGSRRFFMNHIFGSKKHLNPLITRMHAMHRYLSEDEILIMNELEELVCENDQLDYQQSLLSILKCWLFVHIPLSYSLLIFGVVHGVLAYRFVGS